MLVKKYLSVASCVVILGLFSSCASKVKRGVVAMKISDTQAHVGIGGDELRVGDHVELYRNICKAAGRTQGIDSGPGACIKEARGHGEVLQTLSPDYSLVQFPSGTLFAEGDMIEIHAH